MTLPTFLIGGAAKAGTTSLYYYLSEHPDIFMCPVKEPDYFNKHYRRGLDWYASLFDGWEGEVAIGEASPGTMSSRAALDRVHETLPDVRLVFLLRDPVDRLFSHFSYDQARGVIPHHVVFGELIRKDDDAYAQRLVRKGQYADQIERYADRFGRDRIHVELFEDLKTDRDRCVASVCAFVGVDPDRLPEVATEGRHNVTAYPQNPGVYRAVRAVWDPVRRRLGKASLHRLKPVRDAVRGHLFTEDRSARPELADTDRDYLAQVYEDSNARLETILGRDLSQWTRD